MRMTLILKDALALTSPVDDGLAVAPLPGAVNGATKTSGQRMSPFDSEAEREQLLRNGSAAVAGQTPVQSVYAEKNAIGYPFKDAKYAIASDADVTATTSWHGNVADLDRAEPNHDGNRDAGIRMQNYGGFSFPHSNADDDGRSPSPRASKDKRSWWSRAASCCHRDACFAMLVRRLPVLHWSRSYTMEKFYSDLIAGMTVGLTVIPQGLAYAAIANLPLQYGLYSAYMGCFVYMFLGTSKDLNMGPTAVISLMTAQYLFEITNDDERVKFAILLTFASGVIQLAMAVLQLGFLTRFISHPVIAGFSSAAALIIALSQLDSLLGYSVSSREFLPSLLETFTRIGQFLWPDFLLGIVCVVILTILKRLGDEAAASLLQASQTGAQKTRYTVIRYVSISRNAIVAVLASVVAALVDNQWTGTLSLTKDVKAGIPTPQIPTFILGNDQTVFQTLRHFGAGLALVPLISLVEALAIGKAFANKNGYHIDSTQEFVAVGAANVIASCFHSYPITASFSRSALNSQSHVQTPAGNFWTSLLVVLALALLSPLFYYVPKAGLSAIIICAVLPMIEWHQVKLLWRLRRVDLLPLFATFFGCLCLGIELGLGAGVLVSLILLLYAAARPQVKVVTWLEHNLVVIKPQAALYFPSGEYLQNIVQETVGTILCRRIANGSRRKSTAVDNSKVAVVRMLLDASHVVDMDSSAMQSIKTIVDTIAKEPAVELYFINLSDESKRLLTIAGCKELRLYETFLADGQDGRLASAEVTALAADQPAESNLGKPMLNSNFAGNADTDSNVRANFRMLA